MAADVRINVSADDKSAAALQGVSRNVEAIGTSASKSRVGVEGFTRAAVSLSNGVQQVSGAMARLEITQISLQQSSERIRLAQEAYTTAVAEFGSGSQQAIKSQQELESAQAAGEKTSIRAHTQYLLISLDLATLAARSGPVVTGLLAQASAAGVAATAYTALQVASGLVLFTAAAFAVIGLAKTIRREFTDPAEEASVAFQDFQADFEEARAAMEAPVEPAPWFFPEELQLALNDWPLLGGIIHTESERIAASAATSQAALDGMASSSDAAMRAAQTTIRGFGLDLNRLSATDIPALVASMNLLPLAAGKLTDELLKAVGTEDALLARMKALGPAFVNQTTLTRKKGESTEDLKKRVVDFYGEEEAAKLVIDDTTQSVNLQAQAQDRAAAAAKASESAMRQNSAAAQHTLTMMEHIAAGGTARNYGQPGTASAVTYSQIGNINRSTTGGRAQTETEKLQEEIQLAIQRNPGAVNNPAVQAYLGILNNGAAQWEATGWNPMGLTGFRNQRDEALRSVSASSSGGGDEGGVSQQFYFYGPANPDQVQAAAARGARPSLSRTALRQAH